MKILIRFDDICPTMNWEQWERAKSLLDKAGVTALLGVIPDCQDPDLQICEPRLDFWQYIKKLQSEGYAIAMHGYSHVFDINADGIVTRNKRSEFAGHTFDEQCQTIKKGKEVFDSHGIDTNVFFAPAHSYDDNTLKALSANGFRYISDGMSAKPYIRNGVICIPCRSTGVPKIKKRASYTVVLHAHEWIRDDKKKSWNEFEDVINKYRDYIVSFDEYKLQSQGSPLVQSINEKCFRIWSCDVKPILRRIRSLIKDTY